MTIEEIEAKSYVVGGAVRDEFMGIPAHDLDFVVVGATPEQMIAAGFSKVGADFPVFLHPVTGYEYALARTERKSGSGYTGFTVDASPEVTLEEDLIRRDLTINAIAQKTNNFGYHDPYGGVEDIHNKILRHVSDAFAEDPLRVLRLARFAAKFPAFTIDPQTVEFAKTIGQSVEFRDISKERIGQELIKALGTARPSRFFHALEMFKCLDVHFPEIAALIGQTQPEKWHPEGDAFVHTMEVLDRASENTTDPVIRFAALVHDVGKGLSPKEHLPHHYGHEQAGVPLVKEMIARMALGIEYERTAVPVTALHGLCHNLMKLKPTTIAKIFEDHKYYGLDGIIRVGTVAAFDAHGRGPYNAMIPYPNTEKWRNVMIAISLVKASNVLTNEEIEQYRSTGQFQKIKDAIARGRANVAAEHKAKWNVQ